MVRRRGGKGDGSPNRGRCEAVEQILPLHLPDNVKRDMLNNLCNRMTRHPQRMCLNRLFTRWSSGYLFVEERGTLKVVTYERKLKRLENDYVRDIMDDSGLGPLVEGTHSLVDRNLLSAFAERWHKDTSRFYLLVGEMTITLDDVNNLLHILVHGRFFFLPSMGKNEANELLVTLLGVSYSDASTETEYTRGPNVRLSWLHSIPVPRQYGHIQSIPTSPHVQFPVPPSADVHTYFLHYHDHLLDENGRGPLVTHVGECIHGYLDWFRMVSHPYLIPHEDRVHDPLPRRVLTFGGSKNISSGTPDDSSHQVLFAGITERLQALLSMDMVIPRSDGEMLTHEALRMAH
ncbi:Aminotransferase-like, plant mobile domain [Sesbania bispinosa]|nr:Aminotransferase-like, plant mobile domain [Sesbania bispinosa]